VQVQAQVRSRHRRPGGQRMLRKMVLEQKLPLVEHR